MLIVIHENSEPLNKYMYILLYHFLQCSNHKYHFQKSLCMEYNAPKNPKLYRFIFLFNLFKNKLKLTMFCTVFRFHSLRNCVRLWSFQLTEFLKNLFSEFTVIVELGRFMYLNVVSQKMSTMQILRKFSRGFYYS